MTDYEITRGGNSSDEAHSLGYVPQNASRSVAWNSCCCCDHVAPPTRVLRSVEFNYQFAKSIAALGLSGDGTVDAVLAELLDHRSGKLRTADGRELPIDSELASDVAWFDALFSEDQRRFINRYKARAEAQDYKYRLQERLVDTVALMFLALEVRKCRTNGRCSSQRTSV